MHRVFLIVPAQAVVARYIESFKELPPQAKAASFTVSDVMEKIQAVNLGANGQRHRLLRNVRYWHLADIDADAEHVRF